jgi:hypothetical protein
MLEMMREIFSGMRTSGSGDLGIGSRVAWRCIAGSPYHLSMGADLHAIQGFEDSRIRD